MEEKKIKMLIIIVLIIIIAIIALIILLNNANKENKITTELNVSENIENDNIDEQNEDKFIELTNMKQFYTVESCVNSYLASENYNLLDKDYIEANNIKENIVVEQKDDNEGITEKILFIPIEMKVKQGVGTDKYIVHGYVDRENKDIEEIYLIVNLDNINKTFSIEPLENQYDSIEEITVNNLNKEIEKNEYNAFSYQNVDNDQYMSMKLYNTYKNTCLNYPEISYELLNKEYREARFGTIENYIDYIEKNKEEIEGSNIDQYMVNRYDDYIEYVCKDQYENIYVFKEVAGMKNTVTLDTYTLEEEKFNSTYNNSDEAMKVKMNSDKIIQMMNRRDYKTIYNLLNGTFKNNYFKTEEEFETYMKEKYPLHYKAKFANTENEGNTYIQEINLTDITEQDEEIKQMTIIMQLKEGTNFEMSFEI